MLIGLYRCLERPSMDGDDPEVGFEDCKKVCSLVVGLWVDLL